MASKINFKRKKIGKGSGWGVGLDCLLKKYWDDLDKLVENNYYERHNTKLINFLFPNVFSALEKAVVEMKKYDNWIKKAEKIQNFGKKAKTPAGKVIFIDTVVQFLRETSVEDKVVQKDTKKKLIFKQKQIKGLSVQKGYSEIRGVVKIILNEKDFPKFKKGEILVTKETNANFLQLIQKAKAIVTDNGGILCHAAIVAREMRKPCIVGTKIATQILKTGDLVEINTENGVVSVIKN